MTPTEQFIVAVERATGRQGRRHGREIRLLCPAHDDHHPSLDVAESADGRPLAQCRSRGCSFEAICRAIGRDPAEFLPDRGKGVRMAGRKAATLQQSGCTLEQYAEAKQLDPEFLRGLGLRDMTYMGAPAVRIPYRTRQGEEAAVRFRVALTKTAQGADDRFRWRRGSKPCLYGLERLDAAIEAGYVVLVEGESDCHVLWSEGFPAVGVPGAGNWREERDAAHLCPTPRERGALRLVEDDELVIYVVIEPDDGGQSVLEWLAESSIREQVRLVRLPAKDPGELYLDDPSRFRARFEAALATATPWAEHERVLADSDRAQAWHACADLAGDAAILDRLVVQLRRRGLVGEERNAKLLYLAATSRLLERPVSIAVKGPSSAGKSYLVEQVFTFLPADACHTLTAMSERALVYSEEPLAHRMLVLVEAAGAEGDFVSYLVRSLLSEGRVRYETVEKTTEGLRARMIERQGPTGLITTTTKVALHPENETRLLSIVATDTPDQTAQILLALAERSTGEPADVAAWHALQHWVASSDRRVVIPFAAALAKSIPPAAVRLRRDFKTVLTLIESHALIHQASRERDDGRIIATIGDYARVRELVHDLIAEGVEATVAETTRETVEAVPPDTSEGVSLTTIANTLKLDKSSASRRVRTAIAKGYLKNLEPQRGKPARIVRDEHLPDDRVILPQPEALQRCIAERGVPSAPHPDSHRSVPTPGNAGYLAFVRQRYRAGLLTRPEWLDRVTTHSAIAHAGAA